MAIIAYQICLISVLFYLFDFSRASFVTFYEEPDLQGCSIRFNVDRGDCHNIEDPWSSSIGSVDIEGSCIHAWEEENCSGDSEKLVQGASSNFDLQTSDCPMDIRSISLCSTNMHGRSFNLNNKGGGSELSKIAVSEHNKYRKRHKSPPLKGDDKIDRMAQSYADSLAKSNLMQHSQNSRKGYGENLAWTSFAKNKNDAVKEAVKNWYDEIKYYNFKSPGFNMKTGHFTAVVWKNTNQVGIGVAWSAKKKWWVIVANYFPMGNIMNQFDKNVLKPN